MHISVLCFCWSTLVVKWNNALVLIPQQPLLPVSYSAPSQCTDVGCVGEKGELVDCTDISCDTLISVIYIPVPYRASLLYQALQEYRSLNSHWYCGRPQGLTNWNLHFQMFNEWSLYGIGSFLLRQRAPAIADGFGLMTSYMNLTSNVL